MSDTPAQGRRPRIPPEYLQKLRESINILDIVGEHVVLRKSGANHMGLCPFHNERSPSFSVNEHKQVFYCYGCKKGGNSYDFFMEIHGLSFVEAVEELSERAKLPLPKEFDGLSSLDPEARKREEERRKKLSTAHRLNLFVASFFHSALARLPEIDAYFKRRGVGPELSRSFYLGAAPAGWDGLTEHLLSKQAPLALAKELGLIRASDPEMARKGPGFYDLFRSRAMFPIFDMRGRVAGFGGRSIPTPEHPEGDKPKYLNSSDSITFQKSKLAFGLFQAQKHIRETREIIVVEGYFDVLAMHAGGFANTVATCGTAMGPDHLAIFRRLADRIIVLFDGDKAGITATERVMETGLQHGMILHGAVMPEGLDPDQVLFDENGAPIPGGQDRMKEILAAAKPLLDTRIANAIEHAKKGSEEKTVAIKKVGHWLSQYNDPVGREVRIDAALQGFGISRSLLEPTLKSAKGAPPIKSEPIAASPFNRVASETQKADAAPTIKKAGKTEIALFSTTIRALIHQHTAVLTALSSALNDLPPGREKSDIFDSHTLSELAKEFLIPELSRTPSSDWQDRLLASINNSKLKSIVMEATVESPGETFEEEASNIIKRSIANLWARFSQEIRSAMAEADVRKDADSQAKLMKEYLDVQRKMKEFTGFYDEV